LTAQQKLHWLNELDVTIHMRLQLHEYEHIPQPWKEYEVGNGRVTFTVPGEYEVDLTISEEEFENNQFWFLDYRQTFVPTPPELSDRARKFIEDHVNTILKDEGLPGCYKYLHELTLTTKISELAHQAAALSQTGLWIDTLKVERLNRCLSIQYWAQRSRSKEPASWILIGVHSARPSEGFHDPGTPSRLMLQWFRDGKEVKGVDIPFDVDTISVENLLTAVISRHVEHILSSIYNTLKSKPRYAQKKGNLELQISEQPHANSSLSMQLLGERNAVLHIGTWMGNLYFSEPSPLVAHEWKQRFNSLRSPVDEGPGALEQFRWSYTARCLRMLPKSAQWAILPQAPIPLDEVKRAVNMHAPPSREAAHMVWVRHTHWHPHWYAMMSLSLGGDYWRLIQG
jgi:mediator of RNA polymerase II transcription subunit 14